MTFFLWYSFIALWFVLLTLHFLFDVKPIFLPFCRVYILFFAIWQWDLLVHKILYFIVDLWWREHFALWCFLLFLLVYSDYLLWCTLLQLLLLFCQAHDICSFFRLVLCSASLESVYVADPYLTCWPIGCVLHWSTNSNLTGQFKQPLHLDISYDKCHILLEHIHIR